MQMLAQAASRRFSTAAVRVRARVRACEICGGKSGTEGASIPVEHSTDCSAPIIISHHPGLIQ
jgi:hypothetical protein